METIISFGVYSNIILSYFPLVMHAHVENNDCKHSSYQYYSCKNVDELMFVAQSRQNG